MVLEKLIQCCSAAELLSWTCYIEKASLLYFCTSLTLIIEHYRMTLRLQRSKIFSKHSFPASSTCANHTFDKKYISNEYLLNVLIVETSCQFLASRRPNSKAIQRASCVDIFPRLAPFVHSSPSLANRSCPALAANSS